MGIQYNFQFRHGGVTLKSGDICKMAYTAYENDPQPLIIFLYATSGYHPTTKRQWRFIQGINLNYISRSFRKAFVKDWLETHSRTQNTKLTYTDMKTRYPFMDTTTRRYFWKPNYYIRKLELIPPERIEQEVVPPSGLLGEQPRGRRLAALLQAACQE